MLLTAHQQPLLRRTARAGTQPVAAAAHARPQRARSRRPAVCVSAKQRTTGNEALDNALSVGNNLVESAANLVPESVPRPLAKGGVTVASLLVAFWVLQKLVSTVLTIALLGGAAWFYFQYGGGSGGDSGGSGGGGKRGSDDAELDDPLADARRIMEKYRK